MYAENVQHRRRTHAPENLRMTQLRARSAFTTRSHARMEDKHNNDIAKSAPPRRRRGQEALLIRAFLRSQEGWSNCCHNSLGSVNAASPLERRDNVAHDHGAFQASARRTFSPTS